MRERAAIVLACAVALGGCNSSRALQPPTGSKVVDALPFGPFHLPDSLFSTSFTGAMRAVDDPSLLLPTLEAARKAHFRVVLRVVRGRARFQGPDSSFSLALWEQEVDRFKGIDLSSYVADGTILGHYLFDEPDIASNWNGHIVPFATIDSAAQHSKQLWPYMPTVIRVHPAWLQGYGQPYRYLDGAWAQYTAKKGDLQAYVDTEVAAARAQNLGLAMSIEVLSGGTNGASVTADQLTAWGTVLAQVPVACGLFMWKYDTADPSYFQRTDIIAAVDSLARVAAHHARPANCGRRS